MQLLISLLSTSTTACISWWLAIVLQNDICLDNGGRIIGLTMCEFENTVNGRIELNSGQYFFIAAIAIIGGVIVNTLLSYLLRLVKT